MILPEEGRVAVSINQGRDSEAWQYELRRTNAGDFIRANNNIVIILTNDPNLFGAIRFNEFSGKIIISKNKAGIEEGNYTDLSEALFLNYFSKNYYL